jgi:hypothetical protein
MEMPSPEFLKAMTARDKEWGIDFDYLAAQPTGVLIEEITKLKNPEIVGPDRIKKHRAVALRAELEGREDFRRPRPRRSPR